MRRRTPRTVPLVAGLSLALCATLAGGGAHALPARSPEGRPAPAGGASGGDSRCSPQVTIRGYSDSLDKTTFDGVQVGGVSGLARDTDGRVAAVSDRSALFSLEVRPHGAPHARPVVAAALTDGSDGTLDAEALVIDGDGSRLVTSESEPSIRRYDSAGAFTGERLPVPPSLLTEPRGRAQPNESFEGLTALPGGNGLPGGDRLVASMEGRLAGDGRDADGRPLLRFQTWQRAGGHDGPAGHARGAPEQRGDRAIGALSRARVGGAVGRGPWRLDRQWAYPVDRELGVAEVAAVPDGRLLVLERGYDAETGANTVRLYLAEPRGADDVSGVGRLTGAGGVTPIHKSLLADLGDCPDLGAPNPSPQPNPLLDNIEALAVTGVAPGGRLRLLLASDDNESDQQVTRLYALTARIPPVERSGGGDAGEGPVLVE